MSNHFGGRRCISKQWPKMTFDVKFLWKEWPVKPLEPLNSLTTLHYHQRMTKWMHNERSYKKQFCYLLNFKVLYFPLSNYFIIDIIDFLPSFIREVSVMMKHFHRQLFWPEWPWIGTDAVIQALHFGLPCLQTLPFVDVNRPLTWPPQKLQRFLYSIRWNHLLHLSFTFGVQYLWLQGFPTLTSQGAAAPWDFDFLNENRPRILWMPGQYGLIHLVYVCIILLISLVSSVQPQDYSHVL